MVVAPEDPPGAAAKEREAVTTLGVKWREEEVPVGGASSLVGAGGPGGGCEAFLGPPQGIEARSGKSRSS